MESNATTQPIAFDCPRCHVAVGEEHYGPCQSCRAELRSSQALDAKHSVVGDYIPKMNVTPNAVALKD